MFRFWVLVILLVSTAHAESPHRGLRPEDLGISRESRFYKNLKSGKLKDTDTNFHSKGVISKIESEEGSEFDDSSNPIIPSKIKTSLDQKSTELAEWSNKVVKERPILPNCSESKSFRIKVKPGSDKIPPKTLISDILYLRSYSIPADTVDVFGPTAEVRAYEPDEKNIHFHTAIGLGVTCLPYRIRITDSYTDRLQGNDALKNYNRNLTGNGFMHKEAKKIRF